MITFIKDYYYLKGIKDLNVIKEPDMINTLISFLTLISFMISGIIGMLGSNVTLGDFLKSLADHLTVKNNEAVIELYDFDSGSVHTDPCTGISYVDDIIIVFFTQDASQSEREAAIKSVGGECAGKIDAIRQWQVRVKAGDYAALERKCEILKDSPFVSDAFVETADILAEHTLPNDPWNNDTWDDLPSGGNWGFEAVNAPAAWEYNDYYNHVDLGVVDSGFYFDHEDLSGCLYIPESEYDFASVMNSEIHGTHIAGIIGAVADNGKGVAGLVRDCNIYVTDCRMTVGQSFEPFTYLYAGLVACVQNGAKAVNVSIGLEIPEGGSLSEAQITSQSHTAASYVSALLEGGYEFVVVHAAGNGTSGTNTSIDAVNNGLFSCVMMNNTGLSDEKAQAVYNRIILVGAAQYVASYDVYGQAYFSNSGENVDIFAPGVNIYSCTEVDTDGNSLYGIKSGTSQAAPFVTATAGLIWAVNPSLNGEQVRNIICADENSRHRVLDNKDPRHPLNYEYNLIDAELCVKAAIRTLGVDLSALEAAVSLSENIDKSLYTASSVSALDGAVKAVKFSQSPKKVGAMTSAIQSALSSLDPIDTFSELSPRTVFSELEDVITQTGYTAEYSGYTGYFGTGSAVRL
ncbi:MAG: S8 family serine peptidase, partial [Clostridia bacterium]|nr:S8 family serine peptidase [Clostridia bacterium]